MEKTIHSVVFATPSGPLAVKISGSTWTIVEEQNFK